MKAVLEHNNAELNRTNVSLLAAKNKLEMCLLAFTLTRVPNEENDAAIKAMSIEELRKVFYEQPYIKTIAARLEERRRQGMPITFTGDTGLLDAMQFCRH